jgi:hypothetical protein
MLAAPASHRSNDLAFISFVILPDLTDQETLTKQVPPARVFAPHRGRSLRLGCQANLLWCEFCRPIEVETGSKEDLAKKRLTDPIGGLFSPKHCRGEKEKGRQGRPVFEDWNGLHPHKGPFRKLVKQIEAGQILIERKIARGNCVKAPKPKCCRARNPVDCCPYLAFPFLNRSFVAFHRTLAREPGNL